MSNIRDRNDQVEILAVIINYRPSIFQYFPPIIALHIEETVIFEIFCKI